MVGAVNRLVGSSTTTATSYTTASWTPVPGRFYLACIVTTIGSSTPPTPTLSGNGLTWTNIYTGTSNLRNLYIFRAVAPSTVTTGAMTITAASPTSVQWTVEEHYGADTGGTNGSNAIAQALAVGVGSASVTTFSVALANPVTAGNATSSFISLGIAEAVTPRTGWTELAEDTETAPVTVLESQFRVDGEQTASASWTTATSGARMVAAEIKAAPTAFPFSDAFTRADASNLGMDWIGYTTQLGITTNQASASTTGTHGSFTNAVTTGDNQSVQVTIPNVTGTASTGIILNAPEVIGTDDTTTGEFYLLRTTGAGWGILKKTANSSTYTTLSSVAATVTNGLVLKGEREGSTIRLYVNGTLVTSATDATPITGQRRAGLRTNGSTSVRFDDFSLDNYSAPSGTPATGTASLSLSASGSARGSAASAGSAVLSLSATGSASSGSVAAVGTASLALSASGSARGTAAGGAVVALAASGTSSATATGTASLALTATGGARAAATGTAALGLVAAGAAAASSTGAATLALSATGAGAARATGTASLALSATGTAATQAAATGTAALALTASGTGRAAATGTAALALAASGTAGARATGTAALALAASGNAGAPGQAAGSASLALAASGTASATAAGTAALSLAATGTARATASGTASVNLTASGTAAGRATGTAALSLSAAGTAQGSTPSATGTASLTLSASGAGRGSASGTAALSLTASGTGRAPVMGAAVLTLEATAALSAQASATAMLQLAAVGAAYVTSATHRADDPRASVLPNLSAAEAAPNRAVAGTVPNLAASAVTPNQSAAAVEPNMIGVLV